MTKTCLCNIQGFYSCKFEIFHEKEFDIFPIFAQNIDHGYTVELPRPGGTNVYPQCPQSMFSIKNNKNYTTSFTYKSGEIGVIHFTDMFA